MNAQTPPLKAAVLQYTAKGTQEETLPVAKKLIKQAAQAGANIICLPECANFLAADRPALKQHIEAEETSQSLKLFCALAQKYQVTLSAGSLMMRAEQDERAANRSYLISPEGQIIARYNKIHMFDADVGDGKNYRESEHFKAGQEIVDVQTHMGHFGLTICYDIRFAHLYRQLAKRGAEIITIPAAFTRPTGKAHWHVLQRARAIETGSFILASAQYGIHDDGRKTYGHALIVNPWGEVLADAGTQAPAFVMADIDLEQVALARQKLRNLHHDPDYS